MSQNYECGIYSAENLLIVGYIRDLNNPLKSSTIDLYYGDLRIQGMNAVIPRPSRSGLGHDLNCGFVFYLTKELDTYFTDKEMISLRAPDGTHFNLKGEPIGPPCLKKRDSGYKKLKQRFAKGDYVSRWGNLLERDHLNDVFSDKLLATYNKLNPIFMELFETPLFVNYGSLLGYLRDGKLISWDDDFDVGYVSEAKTISEFRDDFNNKVDVLKKNGYTVDVNAMGQMFWFDKEIGGYLDIFGSWADTNDRLTMIFGVDIPRSGDVLFPLVKKEWLGAQCYFPNKPEQFIEAIYGPNWRTPDKYHSWTPNIYEARYTRSLIARRASDYQSTVEMCDDYGFAINDLYSKLLALNKENIELKNKLDEICNQKPA